MIILDTSPEKENTVVAEKIWAIQMFWRKSFLDIYDRNIYFIGYLIFRNL